MKLRRNKKGFTMVELIIVIAVIAVLTAILVPTFIHLASKAGDASDKTIVKNANTQLAMKQAQEGRNFSMSKAVADVDEIGYHIPGVATSNGNKILWDSTTDRFVLVNKAGDTLLEDSPRSSNNLDLFCAYKDMEERGEDPYSFYAKSTYEGPASVSITTAMGFDAGDAATDAITAISYAPGADDENTVTIATNSVETELTINAPQGGVIHDGVLGVETITKIKDGSMHEHGKVGFAEMMEGNTGRFVAEKGCNIKALWFSDAGAKYEKLSGAKVEEYASSDEIKTKIEKQLVNDEVIFGANHDDVKREAIEELKDETDPYKALVKQIESDPRAATATYAAVIDGETNYIFDNLPEAVVGKSITIIMLANSSRDYTYVFNSRFILDANGHDITFTGDSVGVVGNSVMTFRDNKGTGKFIGSDIGLFGNAIVYIESGNFYLDNSQGSDGYIWAGSGGTRVVITGGSFNFSLLPSWYDANTYTVVNRDGRYYVEAK